MFRKLISLQEALEILYKYEKHYNVQMTLNMDVDYCNIILMTNEWEVHGAHYCVEKPFTKRKFVNAVRETAKLGKSFK